LLEKLYRRAGPERLREFLERKEREEGSNPDLPEDVDKPA
jgi:hypothetical protein